jgi:hypothetical protein
MREQISKARLVKQARDQAGGKRVMPVATSETLAMTMLAVEGSFMQVVQVADERQRLLTEWIAPRAISTAALPRPNVADLSADVVKALASLAEAMHRVGKVGSVRASEVVRRGRLVADERVKHPARRQASRAVA